MPRKYFIHTEIEKSPIIEIIANDVNIDECGEGDKQLFFYNFTDENGKTVAFIQESLVTFIESEQQGPIPLEEQS